MCQLTTRPKNACGMSRLAKFLLGGFGDGGLDGFARKLLPPESSHDGSKQRWKVNALGQKVPEVIQKQYEEILNHANPDPDEKQTYLRALGLLAEKGDTDAADTLKQHLEDENAYVQLPALNNLSGVAKIPTHVRSKKILDRLFSSLTDSEPSILMKEIEIYEESNILRDSSEVSSETLPP